MPTIRTLDASENEIEGSVVIEQRNLKLREIRLAANRIEAFGVEVEVKGLR